MNEELINEGLTASGYHCKDCKRSFFSQQALRMHTIRMHTKAGREGALRGGQAAAAAKRGAYLQKKQNHEQVLAQKREYNRRMRARFYAQGLDSKGQPYNAKNDNLRNPRGPRKSYGTTGMKLPSWTAERKAKFRKTWESKRKPIRIVYPDPSHLEQLAEKVTTATIKHCPYCGENIERHLS